jgi:hypothetical protein
LNQPEVVLGNYLKIEARIAEGNPPEVVRQAEESRAALMAFKEWLARRRAAEAQDRASEPGQNGLGPAPEGLPSLKEWLAERGSQPGGGS